MGTPRKVKKSQQLTATALKLINTPSVRRLLMDALDVTEFTIARYIQKNSDNLLKKPALDIIKTVTGLAEEVIVETIEK